MALVVFGEKIDFTSITLPEEGGYVVGYDINTDLLSQMDYLGNITIIGGNGGAGTLFSTLGLGNFTGTHSIILDSSIVKDTNKISLDSGVVSLTTDNGLYLQSYVFLNSTEANLGNGLSNFKVDSTGITTRWSVTDKQTINTNSYELILNNSSVLQFGKTASGSGSKLSGLISTENSTIGSGVNNTVVIGGQNINGIQSNSVYVPYLLIQDGKVIKGTKGTGQIQFTETGDVLSSNENSVIGVISSTSSLIFTTQNGIFIKDSVTASSSPNVDTGITYISTKNSTTAATIKNSVVVGGDGLVATEDNTVYLGNNVNINNAFTLPITDGTVNQVMKTDGLGNVTWGGVAATLNSVTINRISFAALGGSFSVDTTYVITNADINLYGGTEIYLTTNSHGILNEEGVGKFYNPKYIQSTTGFGIFSTSSTYAVTTKVIWGGYAWQNVTGVTGTSSNIFSLNVTNWTQLPFDLVNYNISYDKIKYDWQNDMIIYRNEKNSNIVSANKSSINKFDNPIKAFQWGNLYDYISNKGIGWQNIINSYNENINFRGQYQINITMNNSSQYNVNINTSASQENFNFNNYQYDRELILINSDENGLSVISGAFRVGTSSVSNDDRFVVSSLNGTVSMVISENGDIYNKKGTSSVIFGLNAGSIHMNCSVAIGDYSLSKDNSIYNISVGYNSQHNNTLGYQNTAIGAYSLYSNISGFLNTAIGAYSLYSNLGLDNVAIGAYSLYSNTSGSSNLSIGNTSLYSNLTGYDNISVGEGSLYNSLSGIENVAIGNTSLYSNLTGSYNTCIGFNSLGSNTTGSRNTVIGYQAGPANATQSTDSIYIGYYSGQYSDNYINQIVIGSTMSYGSNSIIIGNLSTIKTILSGSVIIGGTVSATASILKIDSDTKGILIPRMTTSKINLISEPVDGLIVYNIDLHQICFYNGSVWRKVTDSAM